MTTLTTLSPMANFVSKHEGKFLTTTSVRDSNFTVFSVTMILGGQGHIFPHG